MGTSPKRKEMMTPVSDTGRKLHDLADGLGLPIKYVADCEHLLAKGGLSKAMVSHGTILDALRVDADWWQATQRRVTAYNTAHRKLISLS